MRVVRASVPRSGGFLAVSDTAPYSYPELFWFSGVQGRSPSFAAAGSAQPPPPKAVGFDETADKAYGVTIPQSSYYLAVSRWVKAHVQMVRCNILNGRSELPPEFFHSF